MTPKRCYIIDCHAQLLGMSYFVYILDNGKSVPVCPNCNRKIKKERQK